MPSFRGGYETEPLLMISSAKFFLIFDKFKWCILEQKSLFLLSFWLLKCLAWTRGVIARFCFPSYWAATKLSYYKAVFVACQPE